MSKEIYISSTPHETRLAIVENDALAEIYYERENEYTLAGSIYNGRVTRVLPGMQSSFVDIGLERDAFLYITDFMEEAGDAADFEGNANAGDAPRRSESSRSEGSRSEGNRSEGSRSDSRGEGSRDGNREPRRDGRGSRDSRGNRDANGNRDDAYSRESRPAAEPTDADLFNAAVAGVEPIRTEGGRTDSDSRDGGRNRRGGRGRGRGDGRDRQFNSDGTPRRPREESGNRAEPNGNRADAPTFEAAPILSAPASPEAGDSAEPLGEGAPGADGSRRWRGRRGRRGSRTATPAGESTPSSEFNTPPSLYPSAELADSSSQGNDAPIYESYTEAELGPVVREDSRLDLPAAAPAAPRREASDDSRGNREPRSGRGDRNDRGDRSGRGDRDERSARSARPARESAGERRVPRGFAPSPTLYKVEGADDTHAPTPYGQEAQYEAPAEPIILPGESLRKYRPASVNDADEAGRTSSSASSATSTPAESSFVAQGWDGGMVLPGETLRPRGPVSDSSSPRESRGPRNDRGDRNDRGGRDSRGNGRGNRDSRGGRDDRGGRDSRGPRPEARTDSRDNRDFRAPRPEFAPTESRNPDLRPEASELHRPGAEPEFSQDSQDSSAPSIALSAMIGSTEKLNQTETTAQAEPTSAEVPTYLSDPGHAPASHLITPINSTFIAPPPMPAEVVETHFTEPAEYEPTEASASFRVDPAAPSEFRHAAPVLETAAFAEPASEATEPVSEQHSVKPGESADPADLHSVSPELAHALAATSQPESQPESQPHELTAIGDTGNMHSEPLVAETDTLPHVQQPEPTSPIQHEAVIVDQGDQGNEPISRPAPSPFGDGALEEELFEEDEDVPPGTSLPLMHAHSAEDFEQETLENAADLGTMIREMTIDHITRTEPAVDEDDEDDEELGEEEDFLEEDQDFDSAQLSSDDDESDEDTHYPTDEGAEDTDERVDDIGNSAYGSGFEGEHTRQQPAASASEAQPREPRRDGRERNDRGRRDGRRDSRDSRGHRDRRPASSEGGFSSPGADRIVSDRPFGDRDRDRSSNGGGGRRDSRGGRNSAQVTNLPAISDLLKPGQELLCQIAKEPIAKKGARITSHIALPGRFLVFMPTVSHTGVSRKIESDGERRRLKEILLSEKGDAAGGFIVRTAAAGATEEELRSDLRFLLNLWSDIKTRSESSKSPALIYHDLNLVERVLRDQVTDTFSAIWVDTEAQYEQVLRFLQRFQPSLIRRVKLYTKETPLFEQFGITEEINKALRSKVWLKSGGSIVINQTEALVAIDINTGKFVGKTARLEDTIVKTNLDAIPEIVRQIRLRDLGGIIIIDFIDMDERKNRNKVMAALEEELKSDRAPSKVLQFNDFGLVAITRKRVKQSLERTLSTTCGVCAGTGMVKSPVTVCNDIYVEMRKMHKHLDRGDVMLRVHPEVVKQLKAPATNWLHEMEEMVGKTILVKSDPALHPEQFDIH